MSAELPKSLSYLNPFLGELEQLDPDEIDEGTDTSTLNELLQQRVAGRGEREAMEQLAADADALRDWLEHQPESRAHFVLPWLETWADADVQPGERARKQTPARPTNRARQKLRGRPVIDVPSGFQVVKQGANTVLMAPQVGVVLTPLSEDTAAENLRQIEDLSQSQAETVSYGSISGHKLTFAGRVIYFLSCVGGHVNVTLQTMGGDFNETLLEERLAGLRFER